jgi:hypothetical protein
VPVIISNKPFADADALELETRMHPEARLIDVWRESERAPKRREGETARSSGQMSMPLGKAHIQLLQGESAKAVETRTQRAGSIAVSPPIDQLSLPKIPRFREPLTPTARSQIPK